MEFITKTISMTGAFLLSGTLCAMADVEPLITAYEDPIQNLSELTTGSKVVFFHQHPDNGTARHYYLYDGEGSIKVNANKPLVNSVGSGAYAWTVTVTEGEEGTTYSFQSNGPSQNYINFIGSGDLNLKADPCPFVIQTAGDGQADHWKIGYLEENAWFNGNAISGNSGFTTYSSGSPYEIIPVTVEEGEPITYCTLTIERKSASGKVLSTTTETKVAGDTYTIEAPEVNFYTFNHTEVDDVDSEAESVTITQNTKVSYIYDWVFPFEFSNITGNTFPEDTHWYLLKLRDSFVKYNAETPENIPGGNADKSYDDAYWWAFSGDKDGIKVYNKAAGATKVMTSLDPTSDNSTPVHFEDIADIEASAGALNEAWKITESRDYANQNGFYLARQGQNININLQGGILKYWTGQDIGSTFFVMDIQNEAETLKEQTVNIAERGAVGALTKDALAQFNTLNLNTPDDLRAAVAMTSVPENIIPFDENAIYRFENLARKYSTRNNNNVGNGGYIELADQIENNAITMNFIAMDKNDDTRANALWSLEKNGEAYNIKHLNSNKYFGTKASNDYMAIADTKEAAGAYTFASLGQGQYNIKMGTDMLHASGASASDGAAIMYYAGSLNSPSAWYLIPATSINVVIGEAQYATANYPVAVTIPEGMTAYYGTTVNDDQAIVLEEITGTIPANTPVILAGEANTYAMAISTEEVAAIDNNIFDGSKMAKTGNQEYVLANKEQGVGFYRLAAENNIPQNKAYYAAPASANHIVMFSLDPNAGNDGTTGIENVENTETVETYYDLQGRRVLNPTKGIYVTESGKKVFFNK